ncbi:MAG: MauE/DoxX family redox-associated membrane protein [Bacillota bacterium]
MNFYLILLKITYFILGIIFLKNSLFKVKKPLQYLIAMKEYQLINKFRFLYLLIPLLIALEFVLSLILISTIFPVLSLVIGGILQIFYIILIIFNINRKFEKNCGCFGFNVPNNVTTKSLSINAALFLSIVIIYGIEIRM